MLLLCCQSVLISLAEFNVLRATLMSSFILSFITMQIFFMSCYLIPTASSFDPVILSPRERERKSWKAEVKLSPKLILNKGSNVYSSIKHTLFSDTKASNGNEKFLRPPAASKNKVLHAVNTVSLLSNADTRLSHS